MQYYPKFTIVTPSYNQGGFIRETIESIVNQNYPNFEYFVVDGGSTDRSVEIIREYEGRINWWVSEKDEGQSDAINKGFAKATGEILGWVNSDDVLFPECLREVAKYYIDNNKPDLIHSNMVIIDKEGIIKRVIRIPKQTRYFMFRGVWSAPAPAVYFSKKLLKQVGYLDTRYHLCMDLDVWMRMIKAGGKICYIPKYLGAFRVHENSKSIISINKAKYKENSETSEIYNSALPETTKITRRKWSNVWRVYRLINFNYVISIYNTIMLRGKHWKRFIQ